NPLLDSLHERIAEAPYDGRINACGHQAKGIAGSDEAVMRFEVLETVADDADIRQAGKSPAECRAHRFFWMDEPQTFEHASSAVITASLPSPAASFSGRRSLVPAPVRTARSLA